MKRVKDAKTELEMRVSFNETLSVEETEFLQMSEEEIEARSAVYLNEILQGRKRIDLMTKDFAQSLSTVDTSVLETCLLYTSDAADE